MDRLKRSDKGFSLLELIIALALAAVVLLAISNLMINFGNFSANVVRSEESLMVTALGAFEEISARIAVANKAAINGLDAAMDVPATAYPGTCAADRSCIQLRVDQMNYFGASTPEDPLDDKVYTYWLKAMVPATVPASYSLQRTGVLGDDAVLGRTIAKDINTLTFSRPDDPNKINVVLEAKAASGPLSDRTKNMTKEHLETTVIMRGRSAT